MHPSVCRFISESIYEGRLGSHPDCARQKITVPPGANGLITNETGIVFSGVEHDGDIQQSDEEVERVKAIYHELLGHLYTAKDGSTRPLALEDFLFIAPYNAQVRALQAAFPAAARAGSVDKFQGQQAPVCILSLCSSYGEYGSRGLAFILDRNRINVAVSRAQCLAVVVADPRIASSAVGRSWLKIHPSQLSCVGKKTRNFMFEKDLKRAIWIMKALGTISRTSGDRKPFAQAVVDALKRLQAENAAKLDALLPAILNKSFKRKS